MQVEKIKIIKEKYRFLDLHLNERNRRIWSATEANAIGAGGRTIVHRATGIDYKTIQRGVLEMKAKSHLSVDRIRKKGGGRKRKIIKDPHLLIAIENLIEPSIVGDPESPLRWISKSTRKLAEAVSKGGKKVGHNLIARELSALGYSLQGNRKIQEGGNHPDRDEQFYFINEKVKDFQKRNQPVISVDTKKKENIGNFKNNGSEYHKKGQAPKVNVYDFIDKEKGKVSPYGIYDLSKNKGWVNVGISHDTAQFAVNSIRKWWYGMGKETYPNSNELYINADGGGSNGTRNRLWKTELQKLATELSIKIHVSHFPPGTSKWNKIEHRMFCFISQNWRGKPLIDRATVVSLIGNTQTKKGLRIEAKLDNNEYEKGIKISDELLNKVHLEKNFFHGEWNYAISP